MPALEARIRREAGDARRDEALLPGFKALRLNMGTDDVAVEVLIGSETWKPPRPGRRPGRAGPIFGFDLGQSESMAAVAAYWPATGRLESIASFPRVPTLAERGLRDGVGGFVCPDGKHGAS